MRSTSRSAPNVVTSPFTPLQPPPRPAPPSGHTLQDQLQALAQQKDWAAFGTLLAYCPDAYPRRDAAEPAVVLELDITDSSDLGNLADHLPPNAHLPVFMVRGADLSVPDRRIARLTAHRHSLGLQFESCLLDSGVIDVLTQGALEGQAAGHAGLWMLGCTHIQAPAVNTLFSPTLSNDERERHRLECLMVDIGIQDLILASPGLKAFALTGLAPLHLDPDPQDGRGRYRIIDLQPVLRALAHTPLRQLHLDNCCSFNLDQNTDVTDGWAAWEGSEQIAIQQIRLTRWCLDDKTDDFVQRMWSARGIAGAALGPVLVECADVAQAGRVGSVLGESLRRRGAEVHVRWELSATPGSDMDHGYAEDARWCMFARMLLRPAPADGKAFKAPLSLTLVHPHTTDLTVLMEPLAQFRNLRSLTVVGYHILNGSALCRLQELNRLLRGLESQDKLGGLDLGPVLEDVHSAALQASGSCASDVQSEVEASSARYHSVKNRIEWKLHRDRIAERMVSRGLDLGHGDRLIGDVSTVIAQHLQGPPGELSTSLLAVALTNRKNHAAWEAASHEI